MNLENLNLVELNAQEIQETVGGGRLDRFRKIAIFLIDAAGVYDAYNDFKAGWNSVKC